MRKYQTVKDYKNLKPGDLIYDGYLSWKWWGRGGNTFYPFRTGTVPGVHKWGRGGPSQTSQRHYQQLREHYSCNTLGLRLANWGFDYDRVRVDPSWLDPWDYERQRPLTRNWKAQRRTRYRHPAINRRIHSPVYWDKA
jgi:hypothetical protein